jgi:nucleoside-diphosphate-sugar epimerase
VRVGDLESNTDWSRALDGVDAIVHTAARVHVMRDVSADPLAEFRRVNVDGTISLARQAAAANVKRFVFISSIKVNGEETAPGRPYTASDEPAPVDPYGISKLEAEQALRKISAETGMEVVIIRPVLVYGPGAKGNFRAMMRWVRKGVPLPFGAIHNKRSLVALGNLVDFVFTVLGHSAAANETFLVSDGEDLSTTLLLRRLAAAMDAPARLVSVPAPLISGAMRLLGMGGVARRLCQSLQVDINKNHALLGWSPPIAVDEALRLTAQDFLRLDKSSVKAIT